MTDLHLASELRRLRQEATGDDPVVRLARVEEIMGALVDDIVREADEAKADRDAARLELEDIEERPDPLETFSQAIQDAHLRAHHLGHWSDCMNLVCRSLEEWMHAARKDGGT